MQNTNSDTDFDKLKISSAEHISSVESFFSHSGILNKCKDLIASPKDKAIQIFLKEVHSHITKIISPNHTDNDHKNLKEVPWIFYCIFNLLLNLLNTPGHYSLLEQISGLIQLYFDFLEISEQDYGLCFVEENSELINLYTSAHSGISSLKFESIEINIIDIPDANRVGSRNEIDNKNLTDNPPQTETQPNGNELEGFSEANQSTADKKGIKSLKLLSVDLLLVEILEFFFTREDAKDQKDIAKSLEKLYETLSMNLLFYVVYTQSFSMAVVNRLARCALESLKWLFKHKETQHLYLQSLRGPKMEYIEFFLQLLGLNLNDSPSNTVQLRIKVPSHMPLMYKSTKKTEKFSTSVIIGNEAEVSFITDPLFRDPKDAVSMYKETIISYRDHIIWNTLDLDKTDTAVDISSVKQDLDQLIAGVLVLIEGALQEGVPASIKEQLINTEGIDLFKLTHNVVVLLSSVEPLVRAIQIMIDIKQARKESDSQELWDSIELLSLEGPEKSLAIVEVIVATMKKSRGIRIFEIGGRMRLNQAQITYLEELKKIVIRMGKEQKIGVSMAVKVLEKIIIYISEMTNREFEEVQDKIVEVMIEIYKVPLFMERLIFSDALMNKFLQNFTCEPHSTIMVEFMRILYLKFVTESEYFKHYGPQFFSKIKSFLDYMYKNITNTTTTRSFQLISMNSSDFASSAESPASRIAQPRKFSHETTDGFVNMFQLICSLIVGLINQEKSTDFIEQYGNKTIPDASYDFNIYLSTSKSEHLQKYFASTGIYEEIATCLSLNLLHTREIAYWFVQLTFSIVHQEHDLSTIFGELDYHIKFYDVLTKIYKKDRLLKHDVLKIINLMLNLASNNDYQLLFEDRVDDILNIPDILKSLKEDPSTNTITYASLTNQNFIYVVFKMLFEWDLDTQVKLCYLRIVSRSLKFSFYNALICGQKLLVEYLLICLRKEKNEEVKAKVAGLLTKILRNSSNVSQIKSLLRTVRFNYHELYPSFFEKLISPQGRQSFVQEMLDFDSYYRSIKLIFQKVIKKVLAETEDNGNFIHFSGQMSGIAVKNFNLDTEKGFSIIAQFRFENLKSLNKRFLALDESSPSGQKILHRLSQQNSPGLMLHNINEDYFKTPRSTPPGPFDFVETPDNKYLPCLFTIVSSNNVELSLYIGYHEKEKRRVMLLECKSLQKKGPQYRDLFDYPIEENRWYTLVFAFSPESNVTIYLDGQKAKPTYKTNFAPIFDSMSLEKTMIIGGSPSTHEHKKENFNAETSFQGQVSNFLVYPFEISAQESSLVPRISSMDRSSKSRRVSVMSFLKQAFDAKKKNNETFDPAYLSQNSILDLNAFVKMTRLSVQKEIHWTTNAYSQPQSSKKKFGIFSGNAKDKPKFSENLQIRSKGAFFIEKSKFEDVFFSVGNVDVFLLCIDLLAKVKIPYKESIQDMLCEIIDVIKLLASNSYQEDTLRFLGNNGVYVLGYLLQEFINQHGGTIQIAENLIGLLSGFSDIDIKYKGAQALFWKFYVWESCSFTLQMEIFQKSIRLLTPEMNKDYFKKNGNVIVMLDYIYTKLHTIKRDSRILLLKPESEHEAEVKEISKFRTLLWHEIVRTVKAYYDPNTLHKELLGLCRYIAACKLDINLYDALSALVDIFRMFPRQVESEMLQYDKFQKILNDIKLRDLLSCIIMRCSKDQLIQSDENMSNTETDNYITDKIISMTITLIGFAFFKVSASSSKPSTPTIKSMTMDTSSRSDVSLQPSMSPRLSSDKMLFLKLFNRCFVDKMSRESFDALMEVAKFKGTSIQIYEDRYLLSLIVSKGWKLNKEVKELFLTNLLNLFDNLLNLQAFFKAPNFFNFVYSYLDSQLAGQEGNANEFEALQPLVTEVVQKSFIQLLKTKDGMLQIIRISHCKPTECLTYILKIYLKPVLELFEKSIISDQGSEGPNQILEIEKPEVILNLVHLLTYLSVWVTNVNVSVISQEEPELCAVVKLLFNIFSKLEILHSTMPNFKINMNQLDHNEMMKKSQKRSLYKNGGIFFTMFHFLLKLLPRLSKPEHKALIIDLLSLVVLPQDIKKSKDTSEEKMKPADLIQRIEVSNTNIVKIMRSVFPFRDVEGYLELANSEKTNSEKNIVTRPAEYVIYGTIVASLLHRILKDRKTKPSQLSQMNSSQKDEQIYIKLNLRLVKILEGLASSAEKVLRAAFPSFVQSIPSKKLAFGKETIKKTNCTFDVDPRQTSYNLQLIDEYYKQALTSFFQCLRGFEESKRVVKQGQSSPSMHNKFSAFFNSLVEASEHGSKSMSIYQKVFSTKNETTPNDSSKTIRVSEFLTQSAHLITNQIIPILKENCSLVFDISNQIAKIYYDWNMISAHEAERMFMEEFESSDKIETLLKSIKETKEMAHQFQNGLESWTQTERRNVNKITKKWNFHKKKLLQERGIWQVEESSSDLVRYKIDKAEDNYRRRMRLKKDIQAAKKEYINASEYQLRLKSSRTPSNTESPRNNRLLKIEDPLFNLDPQSDIVSEYDSSPNLMMRINTEDTLPPSPRRVEPTIGFSEIPKEEVLACIQEDAFNYLAPKEATPAMKWKHKCEKIALKGAVYGDIEITSSKYLIFSPSKEDRPSTIPHCFGAVKDSFIKQYTKKKQWLISNISQIHTRNYNLIPTAVEIFIKDDAKTYFFNLYHDTLRQDFIKKVKGLNNDIFVVVDRAKEFQRQDYEKQWVEGNLTNFDYLMVINTYAGRSYNDINQYPVFPWVLRDYLSQSIDFDTKDPEEQERIFRPLHLPIGAINDKKRNDALEKFAGWDETDEPKFHYGSHYSNAGSIINFLIRLEPFTSLNMDLQSGKFDQADRLFRSVQSSWESCLECRGDFRELVPEFFFLPEVLKNYNSVDFGKTQTNKQVGDVELPGWAKTPEEFILKHREALECEYVSRHLHEWIDLIFGYKQRGPEAEKSMNVFRYLSYEGAVNLADIKDPKERAAKLEQIFHLGQTPTQIFSTPHQPKKMSTKEKKDEDIPSYIIQPLIPFGPARDLNFRFLDTIKTSPVIHLSSDNTYLYVVYKDLEMYSIPFIPRTLIADFKWSEFKKRTIITKLGKIAPNEVNPRNQYAILRHNKATYHVIGGYIDHSIKIFKDGEVCQTYRFHKKIVTAVAAAFVPRIKQHFIVAGSKDCRITIWKFDPSKKEYEPEILYAHHNEITAVCLESILGLIISADKDGMVLVFCAVSGKLFKTIKPSLTDDEYIKIIEADENGFIILVTSKDKIIVYTMNGSLVNSTENFTIKHGLGINSVMFVNKFKPYIVLSTKLSNLAVFDFLRSHEVRNLTASLKPLTKGDQTQDDEDMMKVPISSIVLSENKKHLYLAFENGGLAMLGKNIVDKELRQEFSEIGLGLE